MTSKDQKAKPKKKATAERKKMDISALAIVDNIVFSKRDVTAYYKITNRAYDFLNFEGQAKLVQELTNALNSLMSDRQEPLDGEIISTSVPVDIDMWQEQIRSISASWDRAPGFDKYLDAMSNFLLREEYNHRVVYIGVSLGKRGALNLEGLNVFEYGIKGAMETGKQWVQKALAIPTEEISAEEEDLFRRKEKRIHQTLSIGHLQASRPSAQEILLLIKRQFYPAMPAPYLDVDHSSRIGPGDIALETSSVIEKRYHWLKFTQMIDGETYEGYRATLSMSKFPKDMVFPGSTPFFYALEQIGLPFTSFSRFQLVPSKKMKSEFEKKRKEQRDELENMSSGMDHYEATISGVPEEVQQALTDSHEIGSMLNQDKSAWVNGSYFIVVETPTEEYLRKYIQAIKQFYADADINITWTSGDQASLFLAQMPGDRHRMKSFDQITNLAMIPASGATFSSEVGDPIAGSDSGTVTSK